MTAKIITAEASYATTARVAHNVAEAAQYLRVSESTIRKVAKRLGVRRIKGRSVAGVILFDSSPVAVTLSFSS